MTPQGKVLVLRIPHFAFENDGATDPLFLILYIHGICQEYTLRLLQLPLQSGTILPLQPATQPIQTGKQYALGDIGLVQLVPDLPL